MLSRPGLSYLLAIIAFASLTFACGENDGPGGVEPGPVEPEETFFDVVHQRAAPPVDDLDRDAIGELRDANTESALRFYREFRKSSENVVFSPLSISRAFASYYSENNAERAAFEALFGFSPEISNPRAWQHLFHAATNRDQVDASDDERSLFVSSDIYWVDTNAVGAAQYNFFDRVHELELKTEPDVSRERINQWIEDQSGGMLPDFLAPGSINQTTEAVATNVVFFLGAWRDTYRDADPIAFQGGDGEVQMEAFRTRSHLAASVENGVTVVRMPYHHQYNHWIIMPDGDLGDFVTSLDRQQYDDLRAAVETYDLTLTVPVLRTASEPDLAKAIGDLREETMTQGDTLTGAFTEGFVHKAAIEVTKEGTRAAAATAIIEGDNNAPDFEELEIVIDRPYLYVIEDGVSRSILFLGEHTH